DYFHKKKIVKPAPYLIEGLGDEFLIKCVDFSLLDDMYQVSDKMAFQHAGELVKKEGIITKNSSGAALWGVLKLAKSLPKPARIATIFPDNTSRYLSTIFNQEWLKKKNLL
ncbi:pyridoxal-phosphate dependent enzyme, partial [Acidobacteriota bacterium]